MRHRERREAGIEDTEVDRDQKNTHIARHADVKGSPRYELTRSEVKKEQRWTHKALLLSCRHLWVGRPNKLLACSRPVEGAVLGTALESWAWRKVKGKVCS